MKRLSLFLCASVALFAAARAQSVVGQVVGPTGAGVAGVELQFSNGLNPINPFTGATGAFNVAVPAGTYDIDFMPPTTALAPLQMFDVTVAGVTNLGTIRLAQGFLLSGTVKNAAGQPLAGCNMDVFEQGSGQKLFTPGDATNALGQFQVVLPAGTYTVRAKPPAGALLVAAEVEDVVVAAPTAVPAITLVPGVAVSGRVVDAATSQPIASVDVDVDDAISGRTIVTPADNTNSLGQFALIVPAGLLHFAFDPPAGNTHLGLQKFNVQIGGTTNMGDTRLGIGLALSGTVLGPGGQPVAGADVDVDTSPGQVGVYTPNDKTDGAGRFTVRVPAGTYLVAVEPPASAGLVGARTAPVAVAAATALPTFQLGAGVVLSGTITASGGGPEPGADLDLIDPLSGQEIVTPGDATDAQGRYAMVVPAGTWSLRVQTRKGSLSRVETTSGVVVSAARTLDRQLQAAPIVCWFDTIGVPTTANGSFVPATLVVVNPTPFTQNTLASIVLVDPNGAEVRLLPGLSLALPPLVFGASVNFPFFLPPVSPALLGRQFELELRFDDPVTGLEQDHDHFVFFIS